MFKSIVTATVLVIATSTAAFAGQWQDIRSNLADLGFDRPSVALEVTGLQAAFNVTTKGSDARMDVWERVVVRAGNIAEHEASWEDFRVGFMAYAEARGTYDYYSLFIEQGLTFEGYSNFVTFTTPTPSFTGEVLASSTLRALARIFSDAAVAAMTDEQIAEAAAQVAADEAYQAELTQARDFSEQLNGWLDGYDAELADFDEQIRILMLRKERTTALADKLRQPAAAAETFYQQVLAR